MEQTKTMAPADTEVKEGLTVGPKEGLGAGIIGLGFLALIMPWASGQIATLDFIKSDAFAILTGAIYVIGILVMISGIVVILQKPESET